MLSKVHKLATLPLPASPPRRGADAGSGSSCHRARALAQGTVASRRTLRRIGHVRGWRGGPALGGGGGQRQCLHSLAALRPPPPPPPLSAVGAVGRVSLADWGAFRLQGLVDQPPRPCPTRQNTVAVAPPLGDRHPRVIGERIVRQVGSPREVERHADDGSRAVLGMTTGSCRENGPQKRVPPFTSRSFN